MTITLEECTDCGHCASFAYGFRVICLHPDLPPDEVCKYSPVADFEDAEFCTGFIPAPAKEFNNYDFGLAEKWSLQNFNGEITYKGIRAWVEMKLEEQKNV
jgi:hypothetical protein